MTVAAENELPWARKRGTLLLLAVIWVVIGVTWYLRRPTRLDVFAEHILGAMMTADGGRLHQAAFEEELTGNPRLTPTSLGLLYERLVVPRVSKLKRKSATARQLNTDQGVAQFDLETPHGMRIGMSAEAYSTGEGARISVLRPLYGAWIMEYFSEHDVPFNLENRNLAVIEGIRKDRQILASLGVSSLSDLNIAQGRIVMIRLDDMEARYVAWNEKLKQERTAPTER